AATEPRRLRKQSYRSPGPLGMAASLVPSNGHAQGAGTSRTPGSRGRKDAASDAVSLSARAAQLAARPLRIGRSGNPDQRTCQEEERRFDITPLRAATATVTSRTRAAVVCAREPSPAMRLAGRACLRARP